MKTELKLYLDASSCSVSYKEWIEISIRHNVYVLHRPTLERGSQRLSDVFS